MAARNKTTAVVQAELAALRALESRVPRHSIFGDDNRAAIGAQIAVLEKCMSMDAIHETWGDELAEGFADNVLHAAIEAHDWASGELAEDEGAPSAGWAPLVA